MSTSTDIDRHIKEAKRHLRKGETSEAIHRFTQALEVDADRVDAHEGIATAYFMAGDYEKAIEHFTRFSRLMPREAKADVNIGAVYNRMGRHRDAVPALRRGLQKNRKCAQGYYNLGLAYRGLNQLSMAVSAYREAIRLAPEMPEAHQNLGNVYLEMGNYQQAIGHYKRALEIKPEFERARRGLAEAEKAREEAKRRISPFGRLVSEDQLRQGAGPEHAPELSEQERLEDRQEVNTLTLEAVADAERLLEVLRSQLEPQLLALARATAQGEVAPFALENVYPQFRSAVAEANDARAQLKKTLDRLRAHEEYIRASGTEGREGA